MWRTHRKTISIRNGSEIRISSETCNSMKWKTNFGMKIKTEKRKQEAKTRKRTSDVDDDDEKNVTKWKRMKRLMNFFYFRENEKILRLIDSIWKDLSCAMCSLWLCVCVDVRPYSVRFCLLLYFSFQFLNK